MAGNIVITGASSGIGAELARAYAERGASLVLVARRTGRLDALREELKGKATAIHVLTLDLEEPDAPERLVAAVAGLGLTIDVLVNNAGFGLRGRFATLPAGEQAGMLALNVVALTGLCRLVLPGMIARGSGGIINVASTAAFQAVPYLGVYAATKAYVLSLSEALHEETKGTGVVVTALCPGPTATEFSARADMEKTRMFKYAMPPRTVAELGIAGHEAGRAIVVTGRANRLMTAMVGLVPRRIVRWGAGKMQG